MTLDQLQQQFSEAIESQQAENIEQVLIEFDQFCRQQVEAETEVEAKRTLLNQLITVEKEWENEILQLKAKVREKIADIKSNGKKINKYLTSF